MIATILGKKVDQSQRFLENGTRIPVTRIFTGENYVVTKLAKTAKLGFDKKNHITKPMQGILKKAGIEKTLRFFKEVPIAENDESVTPGSVISVMDMLKPGDLISVMGVSKGKGFQGGVKRHHFKGGPRTHGQSDRERAPGSIGQTTTPGRVYKGKRMASRMGTERKTIKNLEVMEVGNDMITIKGLVPGGRNSLLVITKIGEDKKFVPLFQEIVQVAESEAKPEEVQKASVEETVSVENEVKEEKEASVEAKGADEGKDAS